MLASVIIFLIIIYYVLFLIIYVLIVFVFIVVPYLSLPLLRYFYSPVFCLIVTQQVQQPPHVSLFPCLHLPTTSFYIISRAFFLHLPFPSFPHRFITTCSSPSLPLQYPYLLLPGLHLLMCLCTSSGVSGHVSTLIGSPVISHLSSSTRVTSSRYCFVPIYSD